MLINKKRHNSIRSGINTWYFQRTDNKDPPTPPKTYFNLHDHSLQQNLSLVTTVPPIQVSTYKMHSDKNNNIEVCTGYGRIEERAEVM